MYNKLISAGLFVLAFLLIVFGGYQCATRVDTGGPSGERATDPFSPLEGDGRPYGDDEGSYSGEDGSSRSTDRVTLSSRAEGRCQRYDGFGARAKFEFTNRATLEDFMRGEKVNNSLNNINNCARLYLDMGLTSNFNNHNRYGGPLHLTFQDDKGNIIAYEAEFDSGSSQEETQYNYWRGDSWDPNSRGKVTQNFYAIFEGEHAAVILKLVDVRVADVGDGRVIYVGAGELWYKMFRTFTEDSDVCHSNGLYLEGTPVSGHRKRHKKCWMKDVYNGNQGPFVCFPGGVRSLENGRIKIRESLRCYNRLGRFSHLNIEEAFNVNRVEELDYGN